MDKFNNNSPKHGFTVNTQLSGESPENDLKNEPFSLGREILEWLNVLCVSVIAVIIVFSLVFRIATIDGDSMLNTLSDNDKVIITNLNYTPKQGDIVVISRNIENSIEGQRTSEEPIIKRIIAVGGQTIDIDFKTGTVYIDGAVLEEDYLGSPTYDKYDVDFPLYVPEDCVFVMGDNRGDSLDSRSSRIGDNGLIDTRYILGHAVFRFFPFEKIGKIK